jgi:hypothetical protein
MRRLLRRVEVVEDRIAGVPTRFVPLWSEPLIWLITACTL